MVGRFPDVAESVFYALRGAVHGGQAQSIAQGMLDDKKLEPGLLWSALEEYYNTALNRANVVLFDIRRLLNIRLDNNSTATKFLSDFRDCLQRLRKNNARLSEDSDTLRALLLVAIQDDDFELVRDSIVHKPDSSVESILTEIRERETSLMMKDRAANPGGDTSRHSRRAKLSTSSSNRSKNDTGSTAADKQLTKWNIPRLPDSWKKSFGNSLFKLILDWRTDAHKGMAQEKLSANYETVVETFSPRTKGNKTNKTSQSSAGDDQNSTATTSDTSGAGSGTSESTEPPRKRIRLQKRRRVVTERSTC
ncbi:hypothetical protein MHU86_5897 [Fragilaria crotonensis]|nr:hypothetical protein MHU86_5897 [Fragilaria crotonensis]